MLKQPIKESYFIPDYLGERKPASGASKTLEQQEQEFAAFHSKLKSMTGK